MKSALDGLLDTHSFTYSTDQYLSSTYCVLDSVLDAGMSSEHTRQKYLPYGVHILMERENKHISKLYTKIEVSALGG